MTLALVMKADVSENGSKVRGNDSKKILQIFETRFGLTILEPYQ